MQLHFADFTLDLDRQELRRGADPVHVEPQVFDLLAHLVRHRSRVVSKDELIDAIWGGRIISEAALSSRINAARRALGDSGEAQALIRTMPKRGFRFVAEVQEPAAPPPAGDHPAVPAGAQDAMAPSPQAGAAAGCKPSIAVLPFANLSQDQDAEYFTHGLTEDIIRLLARYRWLTVLSRHSTFPFRGRDVDPREIGATLGVRYLVQGGVRRRGTRVRITADLVSADDGSQIWSESFDLDLPDIFAIQDEMARQIAAVIEPELAQAEREAAVRKPPGNLDAWDSYQRGLWHLWGFSAPAFAEAEAMFRRAIALEPGLARAHSALAYLGFQQSLLSTGARRAGWMAEALDSARQSVALDERDCTTHSVLGRVLGLYRRFSPAIAAHERSLELNPSFGQGYFAFGDTLLWCGRAEESIALAERALELSPRDPHIWAFRNMQALAHLILGERDSAIEYFRIALGHPNASHRVAANLVAVLGLTGAHEELGLAVADLLRRKPGFSIAEARDNYFFCADESFLARYAEGLRAAGIPEA
ncbi:MAG: winged helix-turn-helix domain-containing protein [Acetobacteraceae bacterium]|nr:winged helix-turn-helix domain-containing protein [Acetobacteraceae bacterium]